MNFLNDVVNIMLPEFGIFVFIMVQLILSIYLDGRYYKLSKFLTLLGITVAMGLTMQIQINPIYYGFKNSIVSDGYTVFFKALILIAAFLIVLLTKKTLSQKRDMAFKFNALVLISVLSALILVSANDFFIMFLATEALVFSNLFLIAFKDREASKTASLKYFITNIIASTLFLIGVYYIYGVVGSTNFSTVYQKIGEMHCPLAYTIGAILIVSSVLLRLGLIPFNKWILEIYEGANSSSLAFLSTINTLTFFGILARLLVFQFSYSYELTITLAVLSIFSAFYLNILAVNQSDIKRLLACLVGANCSFMLLGVGLVSVFNISSVLFYLVAFIFMNIGVFAGIIVLKTSTNLHCLKDFKNFVYTNPIFTLCFSICLLGLAGFPITSGFISKMYIISAIGRSGLIFIPFLLLLIINIAITAGSYLKIIRYMFEKDRSQNEIIQHKTSSAIVVLYCCAIITVLIGIFPSKVIELCQYVAYNI